MQHLVIVFLDFVNEPAKQYGVCRSNNVRENEEAINKNKLLLFLAGIGPGCAYE
jgi:hypothetical protein